MSNTEPGWYPDPSGNDSFLRYWDGVAWTDQTLPTRTQQSPNASTVPPTTACYAPYSQATQQQATYNQAHMQTSQQAQTSTQPQNGTSQSQPYYAAPQAQQAYAQPQPQPQQTYAQYQPQPQTATTNIFVQANNSSQYQDPAYRQNTLYPMTSTDRTLRLIAFIWNLLILLSTCFAIIPLAWMIPMTVHSWGIYKGTKPNTVGFGVCNVLFTGMVSGILLLCSNKDQ